ncbi:hypothetical protein L7F22_000596 [Adiantum nelumboides]|nr:hypothetical protein [Adiantum nelumboides]
MIDGCPDGWAGGIPVCVLSGNVQQDNGCASSRAAGRDGALMKERDYISHGLTGVHEQMPSCAPPSGVEKMECDNVVLSLRLGPPADKAAAPQETFSQELHTGMVDQQHRLKVVAGAGANAQHFWHESFRVSLSSDHHQNMVNRLHAEALINQGVSPFAKEYTSSVPVWNPAPGHFAVPVPKVSTTPAKRPYQDANGDRRSVAVAEIAPPNVMHSSPGIYSWNTDMYNASTSSTGGWQQVHVKFEQSHPPGGNITTGFAHGTRQVAVGPPTTPSFKSPQVVSNVTMPLPSSINGAPVSSQAVDISTQSEPEHDSNQNKAPVGWPPVRSFRRNTLQAAQLSNRTSAEDASKSLGGPSTSSSVDISEQMNGGSNKNAFFVKAKLDGVRICRKVDLKAYDSYDGLKGALQSMFQGFVSDNAKLDLLTGKNYVVTHEDKDGDCLLVGDVPWHMFLESSVKSLRIMKAMDANGIGEKGSAKVKAQANGKPS